MKTEKIENLNRLFLEIIEFLPDPTFILNEERKVIAWNKAMELMTGVKKENMIGKGKYAYSIPFYGKPKPVLIDLIWEDKEEIKKRYANFHKNANTYCGETFFPDFNKKGAYIWGTATPLFNSKGIIIGAIESIRDITDKTKALMALHESEEKFQKLAENNFAAITIRRKEKFIYANPRVEEITGYRIGEFIRLKILDIVHPDFHDFIKEDNLEWQKSENLRLQSEIKIITKDKNVRWIEQTSSNIIFDGKPAIITTSYDITGRKTFENELKRHKENLEELVRERTKELLLANENLKKEINERKKVEQDLNTLRKDIVKDYTYQDIVSKSPIIQKIMGSLEDVAKSDSTILIEGPTGTGKELLSRAIYDLSNRKQKPFVIINCGTIPGELMESDLFGHVKGAFTGALYDKIGKISAADGGTVFFDEIGDLPLNLQIKILRLIQNREFEPVGSVKINNVDIRIIAATNRNLLDLVNEGKFRDDLYYRFNVVKYYLPPLKNRKEDIPLLVDHFIKKFNVLKKKNIAGVSPEVTKMFYNYSFPGNIRELENIIEYSFIMVRGDIIEEDDLPAEIKKDENNFEKLIKRKLISINNDKGKIISTLNKFNWNKSKACKELGVSYVTLWRKIKKYNINKPLNHIL
jgi:PAS domain S-box-containing protein